MAWFPSAARIYRALLFAYPAEFRHEYGAEMEEVFEQRARQEPMARLWPETLADIAWSAAKEHWHILNSDLRYGARMLAVAPGFTAAALLAIALGIGATTGVFSLVNAVLIRSMPYGDADRLVYLWSPNSRWQGGIVPEELAPNTPDFYDWMRLSHSFISLTILDERMFNVMTGHGAARVGGALVTGSFFRTLQARPEIGRTIDADDDRPGHERVVVISDAIWRQDFGARPNAIGATLQLNRKKYTVIGVMPREFGYPFEGDVPYGKANYGRAEIWAPLALSTHEKSDRVNFSSADAAIGRLRPGVSARQAQAELRAIESRLNSLYPEQWRGWTALVRPLVDTIVGPVRAMLWLLLGAVAIVLLIACSNVANLLLARVTARGQEMGIRTALGAERARLVRQILTEALLLAGGGGALGILFAFIAVRGIVSINPGNIPRFAETSVDGRVLLVTVAISIATGLLFGLAPTLAGSRVNLSEFLKDGGNRGAVGTRNRWRHALVVAEVALSVVLLAGAGLTIRSYLRLQTVNPGFSPSTLTMSLELDERYNTPERRTAFFRRFMEALRNVPGVLQVGATRTIPFDNSEEVAFVDVKGFGKPKKMVEERPVTPRYFAAMGMHLVAGRFFDEHDIQSRNPVMIVNESFAKAYLRGGDPLRRQIRLGIGNFAGVPWSTVIGIVSDLRHSSLEENPLPQVFGAYWPGLNSDAHFAIRASVPPEKTISSVRAVLHDMDPALALEDVRTMSERVAHAEARRRFETVLLSGFAGLAVFLALVGLYALLSYAVRQRTAEIGLRMALGASRAQVLRMVLREGLGLVAMGLAIGLSAALGLTHLVSSWLYGVRATDPLTFVAVPLLLLAVACCACLIPALQATRVDPVRALRYQ